MPDSSHPSGWVNRNYWLCIPAVYSVDKPATLVFNFHGFYDTAKDERLEDRLAAYVNQWGRNVITVYPHGSGDSYSGDSRAWNVDGNGLNTASGPLGPTCRTPRYRGDGWKDVYACYNSCRRSARGCDPHNGCNFASCMDDQAYVRAMLRTLSRKLCIDLDRVHATGISAGGLMVYQTVLDFSDVFASAAPVAGSRIFGFNRPPKHAISLLDIHGLDDTYVPANASNGFGGTPAGATLSHDRFLYHEVPHITAAFARAATCDGGNAAFPTNFDGVREFACNRPHGGCAGGASVVQCVGRWGHTWPLHNTHPFAYADLVLNFFDAHPKVRAKDGLAPAWLVAPLNETAEAPAADVVQAWLAEEGGDAHAAGGPQKTSEDVMSW